MTILVTGATGTVGTELVKQLAAEGHQVRAAFHSEHKIGELQRLDVQRCRLDYTQSASIAEAMQGIEKLFLLTPMTLDQVDMSVRLIDAAQTNGVKLIVKLSGLGAGAVPGIALSRWHRTVERYIQLSGIPYVFLRPNSFMQNFMNYYPPIQGTIYLPLGTGKISFIDVRDIGCVARQVLTRPGYDNQVFELTGGTALGIAEAAEMIAKASGKPVQYIDVPESQAKQAMIQHGMPEWAADALLELHGIGKAGYAAGVSNDVKKVIGRDPISFEVFARDFSYAWK